MKTPSQMPRTAILVEGALMVALAFALSCIPSISLPLGGTISFFTTLPIIMMSLRHGLRWGLCTAAVYSLTQTLQGMDNVLYVKTLGAMVAVILLDYVVAYTCLGLAGPLARRFKNKTLGLVVGIVVTGLMRYACAFVSGIVVWGQYLDEGVNPWIHSLLYNAGWLAPDLAIVLLAALLLSRVPVLGILEDTKKTQATV